jgi:fructosamine-3-kinase
VNRALESKLLALLGSPVKRATAAMGGDIHSAFEVELADGRSVFVKSHTEALPGLFVREAEGLRWLAEARALRVPEVLASSEPDELGPGCLVLERISRRRPERSAKSDEQLGQGLAILHRTGAPGFGFAQDNFLATLPQDNRASAHWAEFYGERRIAPLCARAVRAGHIGRELAKRIERLIARLPELVEPAEPPARLHGDLWSGNVIYDDASAPVLIDPAVYGGSREIDLAMMHLFGGFSERTFAAYAATYPLTPGHEDRIPLYQLYPLLAHVNLFGTSYVRQVEHAIARWV